MIRKQEYLSLQHMMEELHFRFASIGFRVFNSNTAIKTNHFQCPFEDAYIIYSINACKSCSQNSILILKIMACLIIFGLLNPNRHNFFKNSSSNNLKILSNAMNQVLRNNDYDIYLVICMF